MKLLNKIAQRKVVRIHHAFDTAAERLLQEAQEIIATKPEIGETEISKLNQLEILEKIGFINSKNFVEAKKVKDSFETKRGKIVDASGIQELVLRYQHYFPFYKFLTIDQLVHICMKYNLVFHPVEQYIGEIPAKNIAEMANIPDLNKNGAVTKPGYAPGGPVERGTDINLDFGTEDKYYVRVPGKLGFDYPVEITNQDYKDMKNLGDTAKRRKLVEIGERNGYPYTADSFYNKEIYLTIARDEKLYIAAPPSQFDLNKSIIPSVSKILRIQLDPVVFRVCKGGIQVITKWGLEASDPLLVNEVNN